MNRKLVFLVSIMTMMVFSFGAFAQQYNYDYDEMEMEVYFAELAKWEKREADALASIAELEAKMATMQTEKTAVEAQIEKCHNDIYALLGTDKAGYDEFVAMCQALESDLNGFVSLSPEQIYNRMDELAGYETRLADLRKDKRSLGPEPFRILGRIEAMINEAHEKAKSATPPAYTVRRGDYLWKIAKMPDIYGDAYAWMRIYTANRDQIKDPDLIYPNQRFSIPRSVARGEHLVSRGESLSSIARSSGNAFSWQQLYQANRDVIGDDAATIYPYTVLKMPGN